MRIRNRVEDGGGPAARRADHIRPGRRAAGWVVGMAAVAALAGGCYSSGAGSDDTDSHTGCRFDRECSDGDPCNGEERCGTDGVCVAGAPPARDIPCPHPSGEGVCRDGACVPATCGNGVVDPYEECDDGNEAAGDGCDDHCRLGCRTREECEDPNACTADDCVVVGRGQECAHDLLSGVPCSDGDACTIGDSCTDGTCRPGAAPDCADTDPCTADRCDPAAGCVHDRLTSFYRDADGDGWGLASDSVCGGEAPPGYVVRAGDCCEANPAVHPEAGLHDVPYVCTPGDAPSFDYDCDGVEEPEHLVLATPCVSWMRYCSGGNGWCSEETAHPGCRGLPACGETGVFQSGCTLEPPPDGGPPGGAKADEAAGAGSSGPDAGIPGSPDDEDGGVDPIDAGATKEADCCYEEADVPDTSGWVCIAAFETHVQTCR